ncbi:hypothetical protein AGMMS49959_16120 [Planctomycetales bacterium]|nr:hypothetical protein AGMMS49959_16120 [Planctomycetales bacterium]
MPPVYPAKTLKFSLPPRPPADSEQDFGSVLVIGDGTSSYGVGMLIALAALRSGAGSVTRVTSAERANAARAVHPEIAILHLPENKGEAFTLAAREYLLEVAQEYSCAVLGFALPPSGESGELLRLLIRETPLPLIVGGSALRAVSTERRLFADRVAPTVIVANAAEIEYLLNDDEKTSPTDYALRYAQSTQTIVALIGRTIRVTDGGQVIDNPTGKSGMFTVGADAVLAGVVAALIAQKSDPRSAAVAGAYLHGWASDFAVKKLGHYGVIAGDIVASLPEAFKAQCKRAIKK